MVPIPPYGMGVYPPPSPRIPPYYMSFCRKRGDNTLDNAKKILGKKLSFLVYLFYMKYQIDKARLEDIIMKYLDSVFFGIEEHIDVIEGKDYQWWGKGEDEMIAIDSSYDDGLAMGVEDSIWQVVRSMFGLTPHQTDEYFMRWIHENLELSPLEIFTF